ncbi:hypothetical protein [Paenibacillus agilis]|uniref:Lipoprotein n=1 Tax=Paenibacillus agilis TaxID=3020863 RepID=A0A559IPK4_9BACL|nr:hypothetical protein [Paenibacillus agilis]TVX89571.1 hypothetical protein FPZ44_17480 [Paenibacillus agilis]
MKNIVSTLFIVALIITSLSACGNEKQSQAQQKKERNVYYGNFMLDTHYKSLEELAYDADLVAEIEVNANNHNISYIDPTFKTIEVKINNVLKGDSKIKSQAIRILEIASTVSENANKKNIVFLDKYEGPLADDVYVIVGVYQGMFKLDEANQVVYDADKYEGVKHFQASVEGLDKQSFEHRVQEAIKNASPPQPNIPQLSEAEKKLAEEEGHKMYLEDKKRLEEMKKKSVEEKQK